MNPRVIPRNRMLITFSLTIDDMVAFQRYVAHTSPLARRSFWTTLVMIPLLLVFVSLAFSSSGSGGSTMWLITLSLSALWLVFFPILYRRGLDQNMRRTVEQVGGKGMLGLHTVEISEQDILEITEVSKSRRLWKGIERVVENDTHMFIFLKPVVAHVIPKRAFETPQHAQTFFNLARTYHQQGRY